jgi:hypothetical protein
MVRRAHAWLLILAAACAVLPCGAQEPGSAAARSHGSNGNPSGNGAEYQDKLIEEGKLQPEIWDGDAAAQTSTGYPRGLRLDGLYSNYKRNDVSTTNSGIGVGAFMATPLHGVWNFDGVFGNSEGATVATLWQRDMPFEGGWRAANGAGMLNSPAIDLARFQPRWFLPTSPMVGALTEWRGRGGNQFTAGIGEPGVYTGIYVPGFDRLGGRLTTAGGQWGLTPNWSAGLQYVDADDVTSAMQPAGSAQPFKSRAWFGATAWEDRTQRYQLNVLGSDNSFTGSHTGAWADAFVQDGRYGHGFGAFHLGEDLAWGNQAVGNNGHGLYYRLNYGSRQWLWDAAFDYFVPLSTETGNASVFANGSARYQLWQGLGIGGGGNARIDGQTAWSAFGYVEQVLALMTSRTQLYVAENSPQRETTLSANQTWSMPAGARLNTTVLLGRYTGREHSSNHFGFAVFGGGDIASNLSLDANLQWTQRSGDAQPTQLIGSLGFSWRIFPDLQLIGTLYRSRATTETPLQILSPITGPIVPTTNRMNEQGAVLILRYEARAGRAAAPLGGMPGSGAGRISGIVYLDTNDDRRFAAGEPGAASVTVVLDGRFSVRTDGQGRFEFPSVASGQHFITVVPDNLPLPWVLVNEGRVEFEVPVRGTVNVDIGAQRMR